MAFPYAQTNLQLYSQLVALGMVDADLLLIRAAHDGAAALFSAQFRSSGKPQLAHLVGTASIAAAHGGGPPTVAAALLHASYEQGDFGTGVAGASARKRREIQAVVGEGVESIVARYHAFDFGGDAPFSDEVRDLLFLRAANELEDALDLGPLYAAPARREVALQALRKAAGAACFIGRPILEAEIRASLRSLESASIPDVLRGGRHGSFTLRPRSCRPSLASSLRRQIGRLLGEVRR